MPGNVIGADRVRRKLARLKRLAGPELAKANERSGEYILRLARVLHPGDGATRAQLKGTALSDGSYLVDFGDKAKVTEGRRAPRPFVNPALKVARKPNRARARRAVNKAVKKAFAGG